MNDAPATPLSRGPRSASGPQIRMSNSASAPSPTNIRPNSGVRPSRPPRKAMPNRPARISQALSQANAARKTYGAWSSAAAQRVPNASGSSSSARAMTTPAKCSTITSARASLRQCGTSGRSRSTTTPMARPVVSPMANNDVGPSQGGVGPRRSARRDASRASRQTSQAHHASRSTSRRQTSAPLMLAPAGQMASAGRW